MSNTLYVSCPTTVPIVNMKPSPPCPYRYGQCTNRHGTGIATSVMVLSIVNCSPMTTVTLCVMSPACWLFVRWTSARVSSWRSCWLVRNWSLPLRRRWPSRRYATGSTSVSREYAPYVVVLPPLTTTTVSRPFFRDHSGEPVPENFWTLWCKGRLTEADTPTIRLGATPSGLTSAHLHHHPISLQAGCPSCRPTYSVKALKATSAFGLGRRR